MFSHLHAHSIYSLLDGSIRFDDLTKRLTELNQPAFALTDHGTMSGIYQFQKSMDSANIVPIIGCELYTTTNMNCKDKVSPTYHLTVLAQNQVGYKNLIYLSSIAYTEGFYRKPRVDANLLKLHSAGLIVLSGCLAGEVARTYKQSPADAEQVVLKYASIFYGSYYLELQTNGLDDQLELNEFLLSMHDKHKLPLVATCDSHYLRAEDAYKHKLSYCVRSGQTIHNCKWQDIPLHLMSADEVGRALPYADDVGAIGNTLKIANSVEPIDLRVTDLALPTHQKAYSFSMNDMPGDYQVRMDYELAVINKMGVMWYLCLLQDLVHYAKSKGIPVGPGRGSAAGSLVCYKMGITDVDPIKHDLLFERFLNPERVSLPDIDIDVAPEGRELLLDYLRSKYGSSCVAQLTTFNNIKARSAIRDAGRALGSPHADIDALAKLIPGAHQGFTVSLSDSGLPDSPIVDAAKFIEGIPRHGGTHAAAVIISAIPLTNCVPMCVSKGSFQTQWPMADIEAVGLVKFDLLGLNTLAILKRCEDLVGKVPDALDDSAVYQRLSEGRTSGVFQVESQGLTSLLRKLKPDCFSDIIAAVSLFRPGPIALLDDYVARRHGARYTIHKALESILKPTYGLMIYQEQVMEVSKIIAGYNGTEADNLRRIVGKKKLDQLESEGQKFKEGCFQNGNSSISDEIWSLIEKFGAYGFNKAHAVAYSMLTYRTAWYKAHHPAVFYAALLSSQASQADVVKYIAAARADGLTILPPNINHSGIDFVAKSDGESIYFGLGGIKHIGSIAETIISVRNDGGPYRSLPDFIKRTHINSRAAKSLLMAGACDNFS